MSRVRSDIISAAEWTSAKLRWQLALLCDTALSGSARIVGALLMHDFDDRKAGAAWRGQGSRPGVAGQIANPDEDSLRTRSGFNVRTVQLATRDLEAAGYIRIARGRGRGHSNRYWPMLEKANPAPPLGDEEWRTADRHFDAEKAVYGALNGEPGTAQLLHDTYKSPLSPKPARAAAAAGLSGKARTACAVPTDQAPHLEAIPARLRAAIVAIPECGEAWAKSWLDHCCFNAHTAEIHPRSDLARGRMRERLAAYLPGLGVTLGEPLPPHLREPRP